MHSTNISFRYSVVIYETENFHLILAAKKEPNRSKQSLIHL